MEKRDREAAAQFMELIQMVSANLNAGYSIENAFTASYSDMVMLFGKNAPMTKEILAMKRGLENNRGFEELLRGMASHYHIEDIQEFAEIFAIAKKSGGRLGEIISSSVEIMAEKMEADSEIQVLLASKKYEQKVMGAIPFFILFYVDFSSRGYFDKLYGNLFGIAVMTCCMAVYMVSVWWSGKLSAVKI
ncbi:MAG: type II secretion system F family protein [Lachnospiraceae bacterium]|nr:type II secretion system F family protein [Lachnospiraceae bacterium]